MTDDSRNEFSLFSDMMGVTSLVDLINTPEGATSSTLLGPFHQRGAPPMPNGGDLWKGQDGRVSLVGREKDLIIAGGLNIYPKEIEELIDALDGVEESAVIGVPHEDLGEAVVAIVAADAGTRLNEEAILSIIRDRIARFKQPRRVIIVDALPRNAMGKVQKAELRRAYANLLLEAVR